MHGFYSDYNEHDIFTAVQSATCVPYTMRRHDNKSSTGQKYNKKTEIMQYASMMRMKSFAIGYRGSRHGLVMGLVM